LENPKRHRVQKWAVVAILADYLGVQYPVQQESTVKTAPHGVLSTVLAEFATLSERVALLEKQMVMSAVHNTAPSNPPGKIPIRMGEAPREAPHTAQKKDTPQTRTVPSSVPQHLSPNPRWQSVWVAPTRRWRNTDARVIWKTLPPGHMSAIQWYRMDVAWHRGERSTPTVCSSNLEFS
jgi:hypothetical protein